MVMRRAGVRRRRVRPTLADSPVGQVPAEEGQEGQPVEQADPEGEQAVRPDTGQASGSGDAQESEPRARDGSGEANTHELNDEPASARDAQREDPFDEMEEEVLPFTGLTTDVYAAWNHSFLL